MPREINGSITGTKAASIAIVAARFNSHVVEGLVGGALDGLLRNGIDTESTTVVRVPGAWELPLVCQRLASSGDYQAVIALGCVIRGDTPHFDYVAGECSKGIAHASLSTNVPVVFGVLTTDTVDQAINRAGLKHGNKGFEAALTALEMIDLLGQI